MTRQLLEQAFAKTKEIEDKKHKRMELAKRFGTAAGALVALLLDSTFIWAVLNFMVGVSFSWLATLGSYTLLNLFIGKLKR